jgi:hypothetical protein
MHGLRGGRKSSTRSVKMAWARFLNRPQPMATGERNTEAGGFAAYRRPGSLILVGNAIVKPDQHQRGKKSNSDGTNS